MPSLAAAVRPAAIIGLLLLAVAGTTWVSTARQDKQELLTEQLPWRTEDSRPRFLVDREGHVRTADEHVVETPFDLSNSPNLLKVPYEVREWMGRDAPITNEEALPTLGADNFMFRQYWRADQSVLWLTAIGSTRGQSFHAPDICFVAANWNVLTRPPQDIPVSGGKVAARTILAQLDTGERFVDLHWYLWTDVRREWRLGATMIRVTVPVTTTEEAAVAVGTQFAENLFSRVLS
jgi:hypothetical protein